VGGRIVAPVLAGGRQALTVIDKTAQGLQQRVLEPVLFVPLKSGIA
jgi:protein-L-isoaspartate(D-aspartate) O-methyltransferase